MNVAKFVKNHVPLCVSTLGLAVLGYLGYHGVKWIINKCYHMAKVDDVAHKNIGKNKPIHVPKALVSRVKSLEVIKDKITMGQGEYVVFHSLPNGEKKELTRETYDEVYKILNQYSPAAIINRGAENAVEECNQRYELIKAKVKELDPSLEIVFVPRTLYELIFIRKCIQEDLKHNATCEFLDPGAHKITLKRFNGDQQKYEDYLKEKAIQQKERKCWHLCYFKDAGDNDHAGVKDVAYRLNQTIVKKFSPLKEGFTHQEYLEHAEKEIQYLQNHHKNGTEGKLDAIGNVNYPGPTANFGIESYRGSTKSMGIRNDKDAQIIRDAISVECSKVAQNAFFLYRGSIFQKDYPLCWDEKDRSYSLSYGTGLFAGCLYDGGATAFHFMRNQKNAYAIPVPFDQLHKSPFYIPPTNIIAQLFGHGEIFHSRTKVWKDFDVNEMHGMNAGGNGDKREHLKSNLTKDELIGQYREYKNKAIQLK